MRAQRTTALTIFLLILILLLTGCQPPDSGGDSNPRKDNKGGNPKGNCTLTFHGTGLRPRLINGGRTVQGAAEAKCSKPYPVDHSLTVELQVLKPGIKGFRTVGDTTTRDLPNPGPVSDLAKSDCEPGSWRIYATAEGTFDDGVAFKAEAHSYNRIIGAGDCK